MEGYDAYEKTAEAFARTIAKIHRPGDIIWIHDYHHLLLPLKLHEFGVTTATIGIFLHIPFPSSEVFKRIPWRTQLLSSMLSANLIGFQTPDFIRHFTRAVASTFRMPVRSNSVCFNGKVVHLSVLPIGLNIQKINKILQHPEVLNKIKDLKTRFGGKKIIVGVDRLEAMKGLPQKFKAFEQLLETDKALVGNVILVQTVLPGDDNELRREIEEWVGRLNAKWSTVGQAVVYYKYGYIELADLIALYSVADVCLVTSLRDGMNLVSQEYIACQQTNKGTLILSEFTGASAYLPHALKINPWNTMETAAAIQTAIDLPMATRAHSQAMMYKYIVNHSAVHWGQAFIKKLEVITIHPVDKIIRSLGKDSKNRTRVIVVSEDTYNETANVLEGMSGFYEVVVFSSRREDELKHVSDSVHVVGEMGRVWKQRGGVWEDVNNVCVGHSKWIGPVHKILDYYTKVTPGSGVWLNEAIDVITWWWEGNPLSAHDCYMHLISLSDTFHGPFRVHYCPAHSRLTIYPTALPQVALRKILNKLSPNPITLAISVSHHPSPTFAVGLPTDPEEPPASAEVSLTLSSKAELIALLKRI
eukprot:TRINITY_DN23445_c0_g1_i1.p1 TRINITY_DN23445_c0_g1~~TRINITY_DN23445_c0_g1_i1.p1  ORF type:complete len:586 (+),score=152.56 TRINITY_DN23445_c0_g1_i1:120-1877(+)